MSLDIELELIDFGEPSAQDSTNPANTSHDRQTKNGADKDEVQNTHSGKYASWRTGWR